MSDLLGILLLVIFLILSLLFFLPVILITVLLNLVSICCFNGITVIHMWSISLLSSFLLSPLYLLWLNHSKKTTVKTVNIIIISSLFVCLCSGIITQNIVPTYIEIRNVDANEHCETLVVNVYIFEEIGKKVLINKTGEDLLFCPTNSYVYEDDVPISNRLVPFINNSKLDVDMAKKINASFNLADLPNRDISSHLYSKRIIKNRVYEGRCEKMHMLRILDLLPMDN